MKFFPTILFSLLVVQLQQVYGQTCSDVVKNIDLGNEHSCSVSLNDNLYCWGYNGVGQLGYEDVNNRGDGPNEMGSNLLSVDVGSGRTVKKVSSGLSNTCAILDNDQVKCWGINLNGQLGLGDTSVRGATPSSMGDNLPFVDVGTGVSVLDIGVSDTHVCSHLNNNQVKCWGGNTHGQLGLGNTDNVGDGAGEMGDNLPIVDLGTGRTVKQLSSQYNHNCAILDDDKVKCWGRNLIGQLGLGDSDNRGDGAGEMGDNLPYVDLGTGRTAKQISTGYFHTCAILDNDLVKCWGQAGQGQLGYEDSNNRGTGANEMGDNLPFVDLGTGRTAKKISCANGHTCAILDTDQVKCWGANSNGQLGLGNTGSLGNAANEMGDNLPFLDLGTGRIATDIITGSFHTCVVLDNNEMKCWGKNNFGQLGYEDTNNRGDGVGEMGDNLLSIVFNECVVPNTTPTSSPTQGPTQAPVASPVSTQAPSVAPSSTPTQSPVSSPVSTQAPSSAPTPSPVSVPAPAPTNYEDCTWPQYGPNCEFTRDCATCQ